MRSPNRLILLAALFLIGAVLALAAATSQIAPSRNAPSALEDGHHSHPVRGPLSEQGG
jgi:Spy/CpxP family protein refolding chaperone